MNPEDYFRLGADAMKSEISVRFMIKGDVKTAQMILQLELPKFQVPEKFSIKEEE